jgi:hypothetical protein
VLTVSDKEILKPVVDRVLSLATLPEQATRKRRWADHQAMKPTDRIPVSVYWEGIPKKQWELMFGPNYLKCESAVGRELESFLRKTVWVAENVRDDHIVWPAAVIHSPMKEGPNWGVPVEWQASGDELGAKALIPPFKDGMNPVLLKRPAYEVDETALASKIEKAGELLDGRLSVHVYYENLGFAPYDIAAEMRGMEEILFDVYDSPELIHETMRILTDGIEAHHLDRERKGHINFMPAGDGRYQMYYSFRIHCVHLPAQCRGGDLTPKLKYEWAYVTAQISSGLGPDMYAEFVHKYNEQLARHFTNHTVYYHGCEMLDQKLAVIKNLPNLRRHHVSPWSSVSKAVEEIRGKAILEVHSHPGKVFFGWSQDDMRGEIRRLMDEANGHIMDLNLSDIHSVNGDPALLGLWARTAIEEADRG